MALGLKVIREYPPGLLSDIMPWQIDEARGWVYIATDDGLVQFRGDTPELFQFNNRRPVRSVNIDESTGRIYAGGISEFGYFDSSPVSSLEYVCLSDSVGTDRNLGNIWGIYPHEGYVTVQGDVSVLVYDTNTGKHNLIISDSKLDTSAWIDGVLWLGTDNGLKFLMGKNIVDAPGTEKLKGKRIRDILPYKESIIVVTADGLWEYKGQELRLMSEFDHVVRELGEVFSADIKNNLIALGSIENGLAVINLEEGDFSIYNKEGGLGSNTVISLKFDTKGDLFTGLQFGLGKILLSLPVETLQNDKLPVGSGFVMSRKNDKVYFGTNRGLYVMDYDGSGNTLSNLRQINGLRGQVWGLHIIDGVLICSHDRGLFEVNERGDIRQIGNPGGSWEMQKMIGRSDRAYVGTYNGIDIIKKENGQWGGAIHVDGYSSSLYNFVQESPDVIWSGNAESGIDRLVIDTVNHKISELKNFMIASDGYPLTADIHISRIDNDVYFSTPNGIYVYDKKIGHIVKDRELSRLFHNPGEVKRLKKTNGSIYALTNNEVLQADPAGILDLKRIGISPAISRPVHDRDLFFQLGNDYIGYPIREGYLFFDFHSATDSLMDRRYIEANVNRIMVSNAGDSVVFRNNFAGLKNEPVLKYGENSLRIQYGTAEAVNRGIQYSTRLNKEAWSLPTAGISKEFTGLREGKYKFEVKAITPGGKETTDSISFKILPPWWRTSWMLIIYAVLIIAIVIFLVRLEQQRVNRKQAGLLKAKDEELERQQKAHVMAQEEKDRQIDALEREQIEKELRHKAQEVANVMLSLSQKNETLQTVKKELQNILNLIPKNNSDARKAISGLQGKVVVDMHSDEVLKRVEEEFDIVHDNFMKKLRKKYPELTNNEVLLCAYLKMNLSTKEIAPMLNISPRGVETMRYRLRKKLNIDRESGLTEFLSAEVG